MRDKVITQALLANNLKKLKVAHITQHVGGGVGEIPIDFILLSRDFENYLLCLDICKNNFSDFTEVRFSA